MTLQLTSLLSPASDYRIRRLVHHLRDAGRDVDFLDGSWEERRRAAVEGRASAVWVCGLLHVSLTGEDQWPHVAVAAPRSGDPNDEQQPVYHGRIVVGANSNLSKFEDLAGTRFAFNETESLSGYRMMVERLAAAGTDLTFFSDTLASGSHLESLRMVTHGTADCAIIDSIVLDDLAPAGVRVIDSVGPYPAPPLVVAPQFRDELTTAADMDGWAAADESTYDSLRALQRTGR